VRDLVGIEKLGTPTVGIHTNFFTKAERWVAESEGLPDLRSIEIPHPLAGLPRGTIRNRAITILDDIINGLTQPEKKRKGESHVANQVKGKPELSTIRYRGRSNTEALRVVNTSFYEQRWTDGFPIVPPTQEAVEWMLTGTERDKDELVGMVAPGSGKATVKHIAINAVMAGAQPAYMPVILAAVEAITDPEFASPWGAGGMQTTTGPVTPLLIVNGPVATDVGISSGIDCFGYSHRANATIGRALRLIMINAGKAYPGINDMKCQGSSQQFTFCVAEKEEHPAYHREQNPWKPLHVERGYSEKSSTVTALAAWPPVNITDAEHCGPEILNAVVDTMATLGQVPHATSWEYILVLNMTHAQCLADAGWSKQDIREYVYANAVLPWSKYKQQYPGLTKRQPSWMAYTCDDSTSIHILESPDNIQVIVAGGACPYSQIIKGTFNSVTKEISVPQNWHTLISFA
jgi:hypothetical protein